MRMRRQPAVRSDTFIGDVINMLAFRPVYRTQRKDTTMPASAELRHPDEIVVAAINLTAQWAAGAAFDNACHMTRTEMESMAELFICCGEPIAAEGLISCWIDAEINDGEANHGDYSVVDDGLNGPRLVDNREET